MLKLKVYQAGSCLLWRVGNPWYERVSVVLESAKIKSRRTSPGWRSERQGHYVLLPLKLINFADAYSLENSHLFQPIKVVGGGICSRSLVKHTKILTGIDFGSFWSSRTWIVIRSHSCWCFKL
jgi:hypothetical protein